MPGFYSDSFIDEIREKNDLSEVVSAYVPLQMKNGRHWACCPFHNEKTPSFMINDDSRTYYCFGCKATGDVITFVREMEHLDFVEALDFLARRANMELPSTGDKKAYEKSRAERDRMYEANKAAARFYYKQLFEPGGAAALRYLEGRGLDINTIRRFGIGYAPDAWQAMLGELERQGFTVAEMKNAGLIQVKNGRGYDNFRNKVIFPIIDVRGRVLGFGGRVLDNSKPKYINTAGTDVFNKKATLFGINIAGKKRDMPRLLVVEGYMDVVSLSRHGVDYAVATLGTALTEDHARLLKKYTSEVVLAYDGDFAGQTAAVRGMEILAKAGLSVRIVSFPEGQDPDEYICANGRESFERLLESGMSITAFKLANARANYDLSTENGRADYAMEAAGIIAALQNPVETEIYVSRVAAETGFSRETVAAQAEKAAGGQRKISYKKDKTVTAANNSRVKDPPSRAEQDIIAVLAMAGDDAPEYAELIGDLRLPNEKLNSLLDELRADIAEKGRATVPAIAAWCGENPENTGIIRTITGELPIGDKKTRLLECIRALKKKELSDKADALKDRLEAPDIMPEEKMRVLSEIMDIQKKLKDDVR